MMLIVNQGITQATIYTDGSKTILAAQEFTKDLPKYLDKKGVDYEVIQTSITGNLPASEAQCRKVLKQ